MKNVNVLTNFSRISFFLSILFTILLITSCEFKKEHTSDGEVKDCPSDPDALAEVKKEIISNSEVFDLYNNYDEKEKVINEFIERTYGRKNFHDTRTVIFDFKVLKEYLRHVEEVSKKHNVNPEGIKVVLGAEDNKGKYPFQTNVLFVPTTKNEGRQSAYTIVNNKITFFKNIKPKDSIKQKNMQKGGFLTFSTLEGDGLSLSGGRPIPPPFNDDPDFQ